MIKYLVMVLIGYLVIGVVYGIGKAVFELKRRFNVLGVDGYLNWISCSSHLDELKLEDVYKVDDFSRYDWYCKFIGKIEDIVVGKILIVVMCVLTWPTGIPMVIELIATGLDILYESRYGEEG